MTAGVTEPIYSQFIGTFFMLICAIQSHLPIEYHGPSEKAEIQATGFVMDPLPHGQNYR